MSACIGVGVGVGDCMGFGSAASRMASGLPAGRTSRIRVGAEEPSSFFPFAISFTPDAVEIALSAEAVAEIRASLKGPAPFRDYHTVAEEAERIDLSEKTVRNLLKEKRAPHYVIGSDIRIDPVAMDKWLDGKYAMGDPTPNASHHLSPVVKSRPTIQIP